VDGGWHNTQSEKKRGKENTSPFEKKKGIYFFGKDRKELFGGEKRGSLRTQEKESPRGKISMFFQCKRYASGVKRKKRNMWAKQGGTGSAFLTLMEQNGQARFAFGGRGGKKVSISRTVNLKRVIWNFFQKKGERKSLGRGGRGHFGVRLPPKFFQVRKKKEGAPRSKKPATKPKP